MDYPRALDSFPEDRGLGVRDCILQNCFEISSGNVECSRLFRPLRTIGRLRPISCEVKDKENGGHVDAKFNGRCHLII